MNRKTYTKPETRLIPTATACIICNSNKMTNIDSNVNLHYDGGGHGAAQSRGRNSEEDDWE
ncbi:MAG: hypothetical protein IKD78_12655 [Bacteroidales bacterium]|nr:hypothetical protein [Bacteroidales bacterium]